jgi:hypothetical protein
MFCKRQITGNCKTQSQGPEPLKKVDGSRLPVNKYMAYMAFLTRMGERDIEK